MRQPLHASLRRAALVSIALAAAVAGCAGTAPVQPGANVAVTPAARAAAPVDKAAAWATVQAQVGRRATDGADYLRSGPLAERLRGLLGSTNYPVLLENLRVSGPLQQDGGLLYLTGRRDAQAGGEAAAVVIHPAADAVRVWLLTGGEEWDVQDYGAAVGLPAPVRALMAEARR